jgi:hypothetical protein
MTTSAGMSLMDSLHVGARLRVPVVSRPLVMKLL